MRSKGKQAGQHSWSSSITHWLIHQWAGRGFPAFFMLVLVVITGIVMLFALGYYSLSLTHLSDISDTPFWPCVERSFLAFITLSRVENICPGNLQIPDTLWEAFQLLIALFFFAAIVAYFTALVLRPKKLFYFKSTLNIRRDTSGCDRLVCSIYAAPVTVTSLNIRIIARVRIDSNTLKNVVIRNGPPKQPLAEPYIPLRIFADLKDKGITITAVDENGYVERMSHRATVDSKALEIEEFYVDMTGVMGNVEQSVFGEHWYRLSEQALFFGESLPR